MNPPRNSQGSAPGGRHEVQRQRHEDERDQADDADDVEQAPFVRSGPRITADGRQSMANAAPMSRPLPRVIVDRYSVSILANG